MKITKTQLRRLIRESIVQINTSNNPWQQKMENIEVDDNAVMAAAQTAADACEAVRDRKFGSSYSYDPIVKKAIAPFIPKDSQTARGFLKALKSELQNMSSPDYDDWHDGARAAARVIDATAAWATPGFSDAYRASGDRGDW